jgi:hypothetical protein
VNVDIEIQRELSEFCRRRRLRVGDVAGVCIRDALANPDDLAMRAVMVS